MRLRTIFQLCALLAAGRVAETAEPGAGGAASATAYILGSRKVNGACEPTDPTYADTASNSPAAVAYCQRHQARWQRWPKRNGQQAPPN